MEQVEANVTLSILNVDLFDYDDTTRMKLNGSHVLKITNLPKGTNFYPPSSKKLWMLSPGITR